MKKSIKPTQTGKKATRVTAARSGAGRAAESTAAASGLKTVAPDKPAGAVLQAIGALQTLVESRLPAPVAGDQALEASVDSLRRLLSELIEARTESVARDVVAVRGLAVKTGAERGLVEALDALLAKLGAIRFEGRRLDFMDPLIHRAVSERADNGAADGVILDTVQPGYRTVRGNVLAKADVVVNRRG